MLLLDEHFTLHRPVGGTVFELVGGNYTNGRSAMAASIVLLQQPASTGNFDDSTRSTAQRSEN